VLQKRKGLKMSSKMMIFRLPNCSLKTSYRAASAFFVGLACLAIMVSPASALVTVSQSAVQQQIRQDSPVTEVYVRRGGVRWARPGWYRWPAGGAIAAGAALGFVTAATAVAWAGAAPAPGMCWYYTDPSRTQGFWDACP
jgi:hypothetical protein